MLEDHVIKTYGCYKAERRWLSGLVKAYSQRIPVPINNNVITKPDLHCGELSQLVVSGQDTGLILTPSGHRVRLLVGSMTLEWTYHNVYDAHYHLVFPVKYRKALLTNEIPRAISQIAEEIGQRYDIDFERIGYDLNHIHLLVSFPPKHGGSAVVRNSGVVSSGVMDSTWPR